MSLNNNNNGNNNQMLDKLEECLEMIHRSRKAMLQARIRRTNQRQQRKKDKNMGSTRSRQYADSSQFLNITDQEREDERLLDDFADRFNIAPPQEIVPPTMDAKIFQGTLAFDSHNTLTHDLQASKIFDEFRDELQKWWKDNKALRQNEDTRGNQADFLTDKYMCSKLDPLPPSKIVSGVRKEISKIIEEFASDGELPHNFGEIVFQINSDNLSISQTINESKGIADNIKKKVTSADSNDVDNITTIKSSSKSTNSLRSGSNSNKKEDYSEKQKKEKEKLKQQYEAYMKIKSNEVILLSNLQI